MKYADLARTPVPQTEPLDERQVKNNAGGFTYALDEWKRLDRFLILGSDSATYYQSAKKLTRENSACVTRCWELDAFRTANRIAQISQEGRAAQNDVAIWALALGAAYGPTGHIPDFEHKHPQAATIREHALSAVPNVCRTATHLFQFLDALKALGRGWGPALRKAVNAWYAKRPIEAAAYQMIKYRNREGYSHKRALELSHAPSKGVPGRHTLYRWVKGKSVEGNLPGQVSAHLAAMGDISKAKLVELIKQYDLPFEALPTEARKDPDVWRAMLPTMGLTALMRNLGAMSSYGVFKPLGDELSTVVDRLGDEEQLHRARLHPFNLLQAYATYKNGSGFRGSLSWKPQARITDALEDAFYKSFSYVQPTGQRILLGLDVSGSMSSPLMGSAVECCEGAAAMAMTIVRTEKNWHVCAFDSGLKELPLTTHMSLEGVLKHTKDINGGGTDCAVPMLEALKRQWAVDVFVVITDNETWAGRVHPMKALKDYRQKTGIPAKLVVVGMTSTGFSIADPQDGGALDVVGFDAAAPAVIAEFARGDTQERR
jgi:60 kDa SS-A/Ro ribonucleoprotein